MYQFFRTNFVVIVIITFVFLANAYSAEKLQFARVPSSPIQLKSIELLKIIYSDLNIELEFVNMPGLRSLKMSNDGMLAGEAMRIWGVGDVYKNLIRVPTPLLKFSAFAYTLNGQKIDHVDNLTSALRVGIQRGVLHSENAVKGRKGVVRAGTIGELAYKLSRGSVDVALSFGRILELEFKNQYLPGILTKGAPQQTVTVYRYLHKKNSHLIDKVDAIIKRMHDDGSIYKITKCLFIN